MAKSNQQDPFLRLMSKEFRGTKFDDSVLAQYDPTPAQSAPQKPVSQPTTPAHPDEASMLRKEGDVHVPLRDRELSTWVAVIGTLSVLGLTAAVALVAGVVKANSAPDDHGPAGTVVDNPADGQPADPSPAASEPTSFSLGPIIPGTATYHIS